MVAASVPGGSVEVLADGLSGINSIAWKEDGRLFATEVFDGDALYEIDFFKQKTAYEIKMLSNSCWLNSCRALT